MSVGADSEVGSGVGRVWSVLDPGAVIVDYLSRVYELGNQHTIACRS